MHPRAAGVIFVGVFLAVLAGCIGAMFLNFVGFTPALWLGVVCGLAMVTLYGWHVSYQRRHLHRYVDHMREQIITHATSASRRTHIVLVLIMFSFGYVSASMTVSALLTRAFGDSRETSYVVESVVWASSRRSSCNQVKLGGVPGLGQFADRLCFERSVPEGSTLTLIGYHSVLGVWYSDIRITPKEGAR